jgi:predicted ArsR family transcriptional regulator
MALTRFTKRFSESTRGRIVTLLRRHPSTVERLKVSLDLTDNAVRAHLAALERDNLVEYRVVRSRVAGKPAYTYALTREAEILLSAAYCPVLSSLLDALEERLKSSDLEPLMRAAGRHLAASGRVGVGNNRHRIGSAVDFLNELGAVAELERANGSALIRSRSCPLAAVVEKHPEACQALASAIEVLVNAPTSVQCKRTSTRPQCVFAVALRPA